ALRFVEVSDAFGAQRVVDHVDRFALRDGLVRTGRLADVAVDAELVDLEGHARIVSAGPQMAVPVPGRGGAIAVNAAVPGSGRAPHRCETWLRPRRRGA